MQIDPLQTAVIFAGGKSSRMGKDKALLPFGAYPSMAEFQYRKLLPLFTTVYLSAKTDKFDFDAPVITDRYPESSPMVALASLFEILDAEAVFILSVDMPMIRQAEIEKLCRQYQQQQPDILIAQSPRGVEPLCGIYRRSILPYVHALLKQNQHRMRALLDSVKTETVYFEEINRFANINTPEEYDSAHL